MCLEKKKDDILKYWLTNIQDREFTNQADICKGKESPIDVLPPRKDLCSHTLNNAIKVLLEKLNAPFATKFIKIYQ